MSLFSSLHLDDINARLGKYRYELHQVDECGRDTRCILATKDAGEWAKWMHAKAAALYSLPDTHQYGDTYRLYLKREADSTTVDSAVITFLKDGTWSIRFPTLVHTS